jgi:FkbM family methyltransferase
MNWRYHLGRTINDVREAVLRQPLPGLKFYPRGRIWPLDLKRFYELRKCSPQIIIDAGGNVGQTCLYLEKWFPNARIYSLEPVRSTFESLQRNTASHRNILCRNVALGETQGTREIRLMRDSGLNTLTSEPVLEPEASGVIERIRLTTLLAFCQEESIDRIDILKMDVQGYELPILMADEKMLDRVGAIYTEVSLQEKRMDMTPWGTIHDFLRSRGFFYCGLYDQVRHWDSKLLVSFGNALYLNPAWFQTNPVNAESSEQRRAIAQV